MRCEVCGRPIQGPPQRVVIDTATLLVCRRCAKFGVPAATKPKPFPVIPQTTPKRLETPEEAWDVVPDYAQRVKKAREEMGLTQEVLANYVGEKESVIKRIELGKLKPTIDLARKLEQVLKVKLLEKLEAGTNVEYKQGKVELLLGDVVVIKERRKSQGGSPT